MRSIALAVLLGALCAAAVDPAAAAVERAGAAVQALLDSARQELSAGRAQQASTLLERALRIEPQNPTVWHYLGRARLELGDYAQAAAMATKSHSLTGNDRTLRVGNAELLSSALQSSGRAATDIERQVLAAPSTFDWGVERARAYVGTTEEPSEDQARRGWSLPETARQTWRDAQASTWRQAQASAQRAQAAAERAEAAARRAEEAYRRYYESNDGVRRRRQY
ncbi:MAG TPA: tetratricopeptide repeat protein [Gammaproteobacteria bacterium]|nr:tetratricopeptide repeat protein [Gammaproteobacteria bacterium]